MQKFIFGLILFSFLNVYYSIADNSSDIIIAGKVIDAKTSEPLSFVTVGLQGILGTTTDFEGKFSLSISEKYINEMLTVSYVGYESIQISISKNKNKTDLEIKLVSKDYNLNQIDVVAKSLFAFSVIKNANLNIYQNYCQSPFNYIFTLSTKEYEKIKLVKSRELVCESYDKSGYERNGEESYFKSLGYKFLTVKRDFEVYSLTDGYVNIDDILKSDIVRTSGNVLDIEFVDDYNLKLKNEILNGDSVYVIDYENLNPTIFSTGDLNITSYSGTITIKKDNLAILKNTVNATSSNTSILGKSFFNENSNKLFSNVSYSITTEYQNDDELYYLKSINYTLSYKEKDNETNKLIEKKFVNSVIVKEIVLENPEKISTRQYFENEEFNSEIYTEYFD